MIRTTTKKQVDYNVRSYPELDQIAREVANQTLREIDRRAVKTPNYGMKYVRQYVLEEVLKNLQAHV